MTSEQPAARFGVILPAANTTLEVELPSRIRGAMTWHFQRFGQLIRSEQELDVGAEAIVDAASVLVAARVVGLGVGYTAGSFVGGPDWDGLLRKRLAAATHRPTVTAASAIIDALRHLGVGRLAAVSPYAAAVNERLARYLSASGFSVTRVVGEPPPGPAGEVPIGDVERMVMDVDVTGAEAVLVSCTGLRTLSLIESLEARLGVPVVSSNQALAWALLATQGVSAAGPGHLFRAAAH